MKLIKAVNKYTAKIRWFATQKELLSDPTMTKGRNGKTGLKQQLSACLSDRTIYCTFNGWKVQWCEIDEETSTIIEKDSKIEDQELLTTSIQEKEHTDFRLFKLTNKLTNEITYAKDRKDIRRITKLSESVITRMIAKVINDQPAASKQFILDIVEIDETSIKEIQK